MKFNRNWLDKKWVAYTVAACTAVLLFVGLSHIDLLFRGLGATYSFISPVIIGLIIAYILNPMVKFFQKTIFKKVKSQKLGRNLSVFLTVLMVVILFVILLVSLIPQLVNSVITLFGNLDTYAETIQNFLKSLNQTAASRDVDISNFIEFGDNMLQMLTSSLPGNMNSIINTSYNIGMGVFSGVIAFILAIYFLIDKEKLQIGFKKLMKAILSDKRYRDTADFWGRCNKILIRYIGCDLLDGIIVAIVNFIFMCIAGIPYGLLISVVVGVANLAPTFGPIFGGITGAFVLVLINPWYALWFIIFTVILQTCDGYIIKPKLFGNTFGVSSIWILIAIIVGGRMFGVIGIMLAIPFAAIFDYVYKDVIWKKLESNKQRETEEKADD